LICSIRPQNSMKQTKLTPFIHFLSITLLILLNLSTAIARQNNPQPGAERPDLYLPQLQGKNIGIVANQTSILPQNNNKHVVDFLLEKGVQVKKVFVPEHGFRGQADAGEKVNNTVDPKTGLPIISLYGNNKKP